MSDPILVQQFFFPYFSCDRNPTSSEPVVTANTGGYSFLFFWYNTTDQTVWYNTQNIEDDMKWDELGTVAPANHIADVATNLQTNYNALTSLLSLSAGLNATNTNINDMATKFNTLLDHLETQGFQLPS